MKTLGCGILGLVIGVPMATAADTPISKSTDGIDFGKVSIGATKTVSVTLINGSSESFGPIHLTGGAPAIAEFTVSENCNGATLGAGQGCSATYSFTPTAPGQLFDVSSFGVSETADPGDGEGFTVYLFGVAVSPITAAPLIHDFGGVTVGTASMNLLTVITNTGTQSFGPIFMANTIPAGRPFSAWGNCQGATLPPGGTCPVYYVFSPTEPGVVSDSFELVIRSTPQGIDEARFPVSLAGCGIPLESTCPQPTESVVLVIPATGSTPGNFGSFFRTGVQLSNASTEMLTGRFVYHPAGSYGSPTDPSLSFTLPPRSTVSYDDLVQTMGQSGIGSLDVMVPSGTSFPVVTARVYNDAGAAGTSGFTEEAAPVTGAGPLLQTGYIGLLIAPPDNGALRFNIGVRTMQVGAGLSFRIYDASGSLIHTVVKQYGPNFFEQQPADAFLGTTLPPDASIEVNVGGSAFVYGATVDNVTNDASFQMARLVGFVF